MIRYQLHRLHVAPPQKPRGLVNTIVRLRSGLDKHSQGPWMIQEGNHIGPDRTLTEVTTIVRRVMRKAEVGLRLVVLPQSGSQYAIHKIETHPPITDTNGNDRIDMIWTYTMLHFPGLSNLGITVCKHIAGSSTWSQHAYGNACDFGAGDMAKLHEVANWIVDQATRGDGAFTGMVSQVIVDTSIWDPHQGWHRYSGERHYHVHVSASPLRTGTPECA